MPTLIRQFILCTLSPSSSSSRSPSPTFAPLLTTRTTRDHPRPPGRSSIMSANNSALKGVIGSKYKSVGVVPEDKPDESQRRRVSTALAPGPSCTAHA